MKKSSSILVSLLALSLAACNGGGGSGGSSSGGDNPAPGPAPVYAHNGLTMSTVAVVDGVTKPVQLAKTFGHSQYYLLITNNNVESMMFTDIKYDALYNPSLPLDDNITKYVMPFSSANINGQSVPACGFNSATGNVLLSGKSCAYKLNAMWADNQDTTTSTFNWKMSYLVWYGTFDINNTNNGTRVGKDCSLFTYQQCATSSEITTAENNQTLSYYLPNHSNLVGSDVASQGLSVLGGYSFATGGSANNVTNMNGDILWIPSANADVGSVSRFSLNYNSSTNTLTRGGLLNNYTGGTNWLQGAASSNLAGDTFFQYNYANNTNVEPLTPSSMGWMPGLDGAMYASTGNSAYGMLKVTTNGDGTFTSTKLPDVFKSPTNNIIQSVGANGNILTADYNSYANYCYTNMGNNTYTKTQLSTAAGSQLRGQILSGMNYVWGFSNTMSGGTTYLGFDGQTLTQQPTVATKINMNTCTPDYSGYLVGFSGNANAAVFDLTNQYALIYGNSMIRVANINTVSNGADGN